VLALGVMFNGGGVGGGASTVGVAVADVWAGSVGAGIGLSIAGLA